MSKKNFYSHLTEVETLIVELDKLDLKDHEKSHLADLIDSSLHHTVLDAILEQLSNEDKEKLLNHLSSEDHGKIWELLNSKVENVEEKIKVAAKDLVEEFHKDIKESRKHK